MENKEYENYHEIKNHYNGSFSYNTYLCSIPLDFPEVSLHWHSEMELIYIKKGCALITIDMQEYPVNSGSLAIVLPGHIHGIRRYDMEMSLEYENIIFNPTMLIPKQGDDMSQEFFNKIFNGLYKFPKIISKNCPEHNLIISAIDKADEICSGFERNYFLMVRSCLYEFFYYLGNIFSVQENDNNILDVSSIERIKIITKYIEENFKQEISIKKMADICNISHSHFMKFFKYHFGTSFIDYLNDYRLINAARMLSSLESSITEIASDCGFDNISYFNRLFKRKFKTTPSVYRKQTISSI